MLPPSRRDAKALRMAMHQTEVVVHTVCQGMVESIDDPMRDVRMNVDGTVRVLIQPNGGR